MEESWLPVAEAPDYEVSTLGRVKGKTWRPLDPKPNPGGYVPIALSVNGRRVTRLAHVLVAKAFIPNPDDKPIVNHINGVRHDNRAANLEWATAVENRSKRVAPSPVGRRTRKIVQMTADGSVVATWDSIREAARILGVSHGNISTCCRQNNRTIKGYRWAYHDELLEPPGEEWEQVLFKGRQYLVSTHGRVRTSTGYTTVGAKCGNYLAINGALVHRLVAEAFRPKEDGQDVVNRLDGNPANNRADNLEWTTQRRNVAHSVDLGLRCPGNAKVRRPVRQLLGGEEVEVHPSLTKASAAVGVNAARICELCQGRGARMTAGGFEWDYANDLVALSQLARPALSAETSIPDDDPLWDELGL